MTMVFGTVTSAAPAFDRIADEYDSLFTFSAIGRTQREVVWNRLLSVFSSGDHILELNCGTGQDALFMARAGMRVIGCDASPRMIERARQRIATEGADAQFFTLATEELHKLPESLLFDGLLSNFGGLNCVRDLSVVARQAARHLKPGAPLLLCFLNRFCAWEIVHYLFRGRLSKAFRRCRGTSIARVGELSFPVNYPTLGELRRIFAPEFRFIAVVGVGVTVPPSYCEPWIARHPRVLLLLREIDELVRALPGLRVLGDHVLVHLERTSTC